MRQLAEPREVRAPSQEGHLQDTSFAQSPRVIAMWQAGRLCDVCVCVEERRFVAHQVVLASGSDMLAAAFSPEWSAHAAATDEANLRVLQLYDLPASGFERVLEFLYKGTCVVDEATLTPTLDAASRLQVWPLLRLGEAFLHERLDVSNAIDAWLLAEGLQLERLGAASRAMVLTHFERASLSDSFVNIDEARLRLLLSSEELSTPEEAVFAALVRWARHQEAQAAGQQAAAQAVAGEQAAGDVEAVLQARMAAAEAEVARAAGRAAGRAAAEAELEGEVREVDEMADLGRARHDLGELEREGAEVAEAEARGAGVQPAGVQPAGVQPAGEGEVEAVEAMEGEVEAVEAMEGEAEVEAEAAEAEHEAGVVAEEMEAEEMAAEVEMEAEVEVEMEMMADVMVDARGAMQVGAPGGPDGGAAPAHRAQVDAAEIAEEANLARSRRDLGGQSLRDRPPRQSLRDLVHELLYHVRLPLVSISYLQVSKQVGE